VKAEHHHPKHENWDKVIARHHELCTQARRTGQSCVPEFKEFLDGLFGKGYRILPRFENAIAARLYSAGFSSIDIALILRIEPDLVRGRLSHSRQRPRVLAVPQLNGDRASAGAFRGKPNAQAVLRFLGKFEIATVDLLEKIDQTALGEISSDARRQWHDHLEERIAALREFQANLISPNSTTSSNPANEGDA